MLLERPHLLRASGDGTALACYLDDLIAEYRAELIGRIEQLSDNRVRAEFRSSEAGFDRDTGASFGPRPARISAEPKWRRGRRSRGSSRGSPETMRAGRPVADFC